MRRRAVGGTRQARSHLEAPAGTAILCSVLLRPPSGRRSAELSLVAGIAVADAAEETLELSAQIKWPNDVLVNRTKVAGILAEARGDVVVLGIGDQRQPEARGAAAGDRELRRSLRTTDGEERPRAPLLAHILRRLERHYDVWAEHGLDGIYDGSRAARLPARPAHHRGRAQRHRRAHRPRRPARGARERRAQARGERRGEL